LAAKFYLDSSGCSSLSLDCWLSSGRIRWGLTILILLLPVIFLVAAFWQGTLCLNSAVWHFFRILPLILQQFPQNFGNAWFYWALVVSLLGSGALLQQNQFIPEETLRKLTQQALPSSLSVQEWVQQQEQRQIAQVLYEKLLPGQRC